MEVHGGGLRQRVFEHRVESFAAAREDDRLRDLLRPEVCHVPAAPGDGVGTFDDETSHVRERDPLRRYGTFHRKHAAGPCGGSQPGTQKATPIHDTMLLGCRA
jgi:hypothetical protein